MKRLKDLQVGDEVIVYSFSTGERKIGKISRLTKKCLCVGNNLYRKTNGHLYGYSGFYGSLIEVATEEIKREVKEQNLRRYILNKLRDFDYYELSTEKLKQLCNILEIVL